MVQIVNSLREQNELRRQGNKPYKNPRQSADNIFNMVLFRCERYGVELWPEEEDITQDIIKMIEKYRQTSERLTKSERFKFVGIIKHINVGKYNKVFPRRKKPMQLTFNQYETIKSICPID